MHLLLTGGGTGGHIVPNLAVIKELSDRNIKYELSYIGGRNSLEEKMIGEENIKFYPIYCGKLRRYFSLKNFTDFFRFIYGIWQSYWIIRKIKPNLLFSKGGYVSLPVVIGAYLRKIPILVHESDLSHGLANKIAFKFADVIFLSFEESRKYLKPSKKKIIISGNPIRKILFEGDKNRAKKILNFKDDKELLFVMGGSTGARQINDLLYKSLKEILKFCNVVHQCGKGKRIPFEDDGYLQFEYVSDNFSDFLDLSSLVISRAGANSLFEIALKNKRAVIMPMEVGRGDQVENAEIFSKEMGWTVLRGEVDKKSFLYAVKESMLRDEPKNVKFKNGSKEIVDQIIKMYNENCD